MNRRNFFRGVLAGAMLGATRFLPLPTAPSVEMDQFIYNRATGKVEPYEPILVQDVFDGEREIRECNWISSSDLRNELLDDLAWIEVDGELPHRFKIETPLPVWKER